MKKDYSFPKVTAVRFVTKEDLAAGAILSSDPNEVEATIDPNVGEGPF